MNNFFKRLKFALMGMTFDSKPFNEDPFIEQAVARLKWKHQLNIAIETGTYHGVTTEWLGKRFEVAYTVEWVEANMNRARSRFQRSGLKNIGTAIGDSPEWLKRFIQTHPDGRFFIFLDAHWYDNNPLLRELEAIRLTGIRPVIAIHDFKNPQHPEYGFDEYPSQKIVYEWDYIAKEVEALYGKGKYLVNYNDHAAGAKRGVIYIEPKNL